MSVIAFYRPTRSTVIYGLVGREFLPSALALNSMISTAVRGSSTAIGGTIIAFAGTGWSFVFAFVLYCVMTLALHRVQRAGLTMPPAQAHHRSILSPSTSAVSATSFIMRVSAAVAAARRDLARGQALPDLMPGFASRLRSRLKMALRCCSVAKASARWSAAQPRSPRVPAWSASPASPSPTSC